MLLIISSKESGLFIGSCFWNNYSYKYLQSLIRICWRSFFFFFFAKLPHYYLCDLCPQGVVQSRQVDYEALPDEEQQCCKCRTTCFLSGISCACTPRKMACLYHAQDLCSCPHANLTFKWVFSINDKHAFLPPEFHFLWCNSHKLSCITVQMLSGRNIVWNNVNAGSHMLYCRQICFCKIKTFPVGRNSYIKCDQLLLLSINACTFVSPVLSYKFTLDKLYSMKALVTQRAESYKDWVINVQEILENKESKKKG